jgi:hypothetical protein
MVETRHAWKRREFGSCSRRVIDRMGDRVEGERRRGTTGFVLQGDRRLFLGLCLRTTDGGGATIRRFGWPWMGSGPDRQAEAALSSKAHPPIAAGTGDRWRGRKSGRDRYHPPHAARYHPGHHTVRFDGSCFTDVHPRCAEAADRGTPALGCAWAASEKHPQLTSQHDASRATRQEPAWILDKDAESISLQWEQ